MIDQDTLNQDPFHVSGIAAHEETKRQLASTQEQLREAVELLREISVFGVVMHYIGYDDETILCGVCSGERQDLEGNIIHEDNCGYTEALAFLAKYDKERTE